MLQVQDRRQVRSWTTKSWHPFSTAAVCDPKSNKVVAVINSVILTQWDYSEDDIDKVKRMTVSLSRVIFH